MTRKQKKALGRIIAAALIFVLGLCLKLPAKAQLLVFLAAYLVVGWDILYKAVRNLLHGQMLDENFLMSIATVGAFAVGEYPEGVAVMLFYQVGELFQSCAVERSRRSIAQLMDIRPDYANLERDGQLLQVDPDEVAIGDIIVVKPGEKIPLDGQVVEGESAVDASALTGESVPLDLAPGQNAVSGCINLNGLLKIRVTKEFGQSTVAKILDLVENASAQKASSEAFITRFARWYTPVVVACAVVLAAGVPLVLGNFSEWFHRALIFLVISCPCALVISVPLSFFGGIGGASKRGILVKGSNYLEALAKAKIVVFDKTGTLTKGSFAVSDILPAEGVTNEELLNTAALCEWYSTHPISVSLRQAAQAALDENRLGQVQELAGRGVKAVVDGKVCLCGNGRLMEENQIAYTPCQAAGTVVYLAVEGRYFGALVISDQLKQDAALAVSRLKQQGVERVVMLTGDSERSASQVAKQLGVDEYRAGLLPADKVAQVEQLLGKTGPDEKLVFVGDGINDAPVLARADIGVAMGGLGSDAAIEAADIVLMNDAPSGVATACTIARCTLAIVRQNVVFALAVKLAVLALGAFGFANMWEAVFADVGVSVIAILNATRALHTEHL
ncbi:MAG: cadmium-translocating P-type ATPase [Pygmaiobacter massiliensis]|nr:cadmium-translocating P-type ATPase [Pygmaiobacter massiliensis]